MAAVVKDYQMPADEQGLADCIIAWGRHLIILNKSSHIVMPFLMHETTTSEDVESMDALIYGE